MLHDYLKVNLDSFYDADPAEFLCSHQKNFAQHDTNSVLSVADECEGDDDGCGAGVRHPADDDRQTAV